MRHYAVYDSPQAKRKRETPMGVIIVFNENGRAYSPYGGCLYDACGTTTDRDSDQICGTVVGSNWLAACCRRISRRVAGEISPRMMALFTACDRREREAQRQTKKG